MSKSIRVGIIGTGGIAGQHLRSYRMIEDVEVVAVADIVPGKAENFVRRWEIPDVAAYEDYRKMLELDLDGVSICTPNAAHFHPTVDALRAGKHVMLEKPMSVTLEESIEMVGTAKETGRRSDGGYRMLLSRFGFTCTRVPEAIDRFRYYIESFRDKLAIPSGSGFL
jgi:predicted dehydrogenase